MLKRNGFLITLAASAFLIAACSRTNSNTVVGADPAAAQAHADSLDAAQVGPAYRLNQDAATQQRVAGLKNSSSPDASDLQAQTSLPTFGAAAGGAGVPAMKPRPSMAKALLKSSAHALAKGAAAYASAGSADAAISDTSWFIYDDSAKGSIAWIHVYAITDSLGAGTSRDSLRYAWPYSPSNPAVLSHQSVHAYAGGVTLTYSVFDQDGDGILNQAVAGKPVKLLKQWVTVSADTTWKTLTYTTHGGTTYYDSLGAGAPTSWTDSIFVKGETVWWERIYDGDGDGYVLTAAAGGKIKIRRDSYSKTADGDFRFDFETVGPGPDGDYYASADNEVYPFSTRLVDAKGKDLAQISYADADGDGYYFNPAADKNIASVTTAYPVSDSVTAHSDSLVESLSGPGGANAKVSFFVSKEKYADGRAETLSARLPGDAGAFTGGDTVEIWARTDYTGYKSKGSADPFDDLDSSLQVTWVIPHDLGASSDDRITRWYSRDYMKPGRPMISSAKEFTPAQPLAPGDKPQAGSLVTEDMLNPTSGKSVVRDVRYVDFDPASSTRDWKEVRYFESGDSAVSNGHAADAHADAYTRDLGPGARNTGWVDADAGQFKDTVVFLDAKGKALGSEICWGAFDAAKGTGDYYRKRTSGDTATVHFTVTVDGAGTHVARSGGEDAGEIVIQGDTARWSATSGGATRSLTWSAKGAGAYVVEQKDVDAKDGTTLAQGEYVFGQDFSGTGTLTRTPKGGAQSDLKVLFRADGEAFVDGVLVSR